MSEFVKSKMKFKNKEVLLHTLNEEFPSLVKEGEKLEILAYGQTKQVEIGVYTRHQQYGKNKFIGDFGFIENKETGEWDMFIDDYDEYKLKQFHLKYTENEVKYDFIPEWNLEGYNFERKETEDEIIYEGTKW